MAISELTAEPVVTDTWVKASWEEFLALGDRPDLADGRFYYDRGEMRIELMPVGSTHGRHNFVISKVISLYASLNQIRIVGYSNVSFRQAAVRECQPDLSFYIGSDFRFPPQTDSPIDLNEFDPPTLAVEIGVTSLGDDLGRKRLLYEQLGVLEYWVVDARDRQAIAFEICQGRSGQIWDSQVLSGLGLSVVEEALQRSNTEDDGAIIRWLIQKFSQQPTVNSQTVT